MKVLTTKKYKRLCHLIAANQIILNSISSLEGLDKFSALGQSLDNTTEIFYILGGTKLLEGAKKIIFDRTI